MAPSSNVFLTTLMLISVAVNSLPSPPVDIVGGTTARPGDFPYVVSLQTSSHICGGTLITSRQVLTAAHCTAGRQANRLKVRAGSLQQNSGGQLIQVAAIHNHPNYDAGTISNDIAIIDLAQPVQNIKPATLPLLLSEPTVGELVKIAGWGTTSQGGSSLPTNLQKVSVPVISDDDCRTRYEDFTNEEFCTLAPGGGKDATKEIVEDLPLRVMIL